MSDEMKDSAPETEPSPDAENTVPEADGTAVVAEKESPYKGFWKKMDNYFGITKSGSSYRVEVIAGLTTFMAMVYILMVNSGMFQYVIPAGNYTDAYGAAYIATAIGAIAGTLLMAFLAKMPLAQASGMGVNAFVVYTLVMTNGLTYANAMVFTLLDGVIFLILTATGLRKTIFKAIPNGVRAAIPVGIGLFIAYIGCQDAYLIVGNSSTLTGFASFNVLNTQFVGTSPIYADDGITIIGTELSNSGILFALVAILGVIAIAIMSHKKVKGAVLWGILGSAVLYYILLAIAYAAGSEGASLVFQGITWSNPLNAFKNWGKFSVGQVFASGFNFSAYLENNTVASLVLVLITSALSLCMIDMFDTIGTLYGACAKGNLLDENGTPIRMEKMMLADSIATCVGSIAGTSTVTTFVESSSGVTAGGKTGFTALIVALCFLVAMFLSPIAEIIPSCATATALIWVGVLMMTNVTKINWEGAADAVVAFLTIIVMLLGYSISKGIGIGIIASIIIKICTGKIKEIHVATWVIGVLYLATFLLTD
ncbi:MAG: NCS2 family permease [Clostridia bacterium]|nr:NCS2 family permease [Clostridia bacterium]